MKNRLFNILLGLTYIAFFTGCRTDLTHCEYDINFKESECKSNYELWKNNRPESYIFIYEVGTQSSLGVNEWRVKVTVNGDSKEVQFITEYGEPYIPKYSEYPYRVPEKDEAEYIDSIDDLFEEILNQYNSHESNINNEKYWSVTFNVDYNSNLYYPEKVYFSIYYDKSRLDSNGNTLPGAGSDYLYNIIIREFDVLE